MLHIGEGHSKNFQIIFQSFGYDIFCNNLQHIKHLKQIWRYQPEVLITYVLQIGEG